MNRMIASTLALVALLTWHSPARAYDCAELISTNWPRSITNDLLVTPLVVDLDDDGIPEVISLELHPLTRAATLSVLGADGAVLAFNFGIALRSCTPAAGDLDGDGEIEIVALTDQDEVIALQYDGTLFLQEWGRTDPMVLKTFNPTIGIANMDEAGNAEIYIESYVVDTSSAPNLVEHAGFPAGGRGIDSSLDSASITTVADVTSDPGLELVAGNSIYSYTGIGLDRVAHLASLPDGGTSVADLDGDGSPEILHWRSEIVVGPPSSSGSKLTILNPEPFSAYGSPLAFTAPTAGGARLGTPLVAELNGTSQVEVVVKKADTLRPYNWQPASGFTALWAGAYVVDDPSGASAPTAFDFDGVFKEDIVIADEFNLHVVDGDTGVAYQTFANASVTGVENAVVVDMDDDCLPEILVNSSTATGSMLRVFDCDAEVPIRKIWNQFSQHFTQVEDDGGIPLSESEHWLSENTTMTQHGPMDGCTDCCTCVTRGFEGLDAGDVAEFAGMTITGSYTGGGSAPVLIFDTQSPTCADFDLVTPGGPGNTIARGDVLIIQEDNSPPCAPDDNARGGTIRIEFDVPTDIDSIGFLDIDPDEDCGYVAPCDAGKFADVIDIPPHYDNGWQDVTVDFVAETCIEIVLCGSGAVTDIFCEE